MGEDAGTTPTAGVARPALHRSPLTGEERDRLRVLRVATEPNADRYSAILAVFVEARDRYEIELRTDDVVEALAGSGIPGEVVEQALAQLDEWGNVTWVQDTARVSRIEDFRRRRAIWQLTPAGLAAHDAIAAVLGASDRTGSLQRSLFREIREGLRMLGEALDRSEPTDVYLRMRDLDGSLRDLAANARDFHAAVAQLRRENDVDPERFLAYKHALIEYLEEFLEDFLVERSLINAAVAEVAVRGVDRVAALAAAGDDSAGLFAEVDLEATWRARWEGLVAWFAPTSDRPTGADDLSAATTGAIKDLLELLRRVSESARRPITRASELVVLARWFHRLPDDESAAVLFDAAFGLGRPVHLAEEDPDPERIAPSTSWWDAEPVDVGVTLREHGRLPSPGRPGRAEDFSATKARLAAEHEAARRARIEAAARLVARPIVGRTLSAAEAAVLLELLDRAAHQRPVGDQPGSAAPVVVEGAAARLVPDAGGMVIHTTQGALALDEHRLDIAPAGPLR